MSSRILDVGSEIAGYRIESVIGRGGMGVVYLADHLRLKRKVALKVLAPELSADERFRDRFIKESELAASLEEPNIVPIYDAGEAEGHLYIAMRYVQGTDLKALIDEEGALDPTRAATIVSQVASALDAAHDKGLVHRDVKPANVLLDRGDRAYLTDFGLTKHRDSVSGLTRTGQFLGTVDYAAPEQFEGKPLDRRADVYSLGCVAFECLTGKVPYPRETEVAAMFAHIKDPVPAPSALRPELGRGLDAILARAMAKSPDRRSPTAGAFADDLRQAVGSQPPTPGRPRRPRPSRRALAVAGGGLAAVIAVILVVVAVTRGGGDPDGPNPSPTGSPSTVVAGEGAALRVDPATNRVVAKAGSVGFVAVGGGFVWISSANGLQKVSPQNNKVIGTIPLVPDDMTFGDGYLWATSSRTSGFPFGGAPVTDSLYRTDPRTNRISKVATLPERVIQDFSFAIHSMAIGAGSVWVAIQATTGEDLLLGYDERTGDEVDRIRLSEPPAGIAFGEGSLWIRYNGLAPRVDRIDPRTGKVVKRIEVSAADGLAVGAGAVWVSDSSNDVVVKIDPSTNTLAGQISRGFDAPQEITAGEDRVWVLNANACTVARIDPATSRVVATIPVTFPPVLATIADGPEGVWVGGLRLPQLACTGT